MRRTITTVAALALAASVAACTSGGAGSNGPAGAFAHAADYQITSCGVDSVNYPHATVKLTNHSSGSSDYVGSIRFQSADGKTQFGTGAVFANNVTPGQTTTVDAVSPTTVPVGTKITCELADADRMASH